MFVLQKQILIIGLPEIRDIIYIHTIIAAGLSKTTDRQSILKQARCVNRQLAIPE